MTYGAQTWSLTVKQNNKIRVCQRAMERSMLKISKRHRIRATLIRQKTGVTDAIKLSKSLKWKWAGHVIRKVHDPWDKTTTVWLPREGRRNRGRQRTRWREEIVSFTGPTWTRQALDRTRWKELGEAFAQQWDSSS